MIRDPGAELTEAVGALVWANEAAAIKIRSKRAKQVRKFDSMIIVRTRLSLRPKVRSLMLRRSRHCTRGASSRDATRMNLSCSDKGADGEIIAEHIERIPQTPGSGREGILLQSGSQENKW